jgi:CheY-specific phosphatase CheX
MHSQSQIAQSLATPSDAWLVSSVIQTLSGLYGQELEVFAAEPATTIALGTTASIDLVLEAGQCRVTALVACAPEHAVRVASCLLRRNVTLQDGGTDILGESANTIGGRIKATLVERGFALRLGLPKIDVTPVVIDVGAWDSCTWVRTASDERFFISVRADPAAGLGPPSSWAVTAHTAREPEGDIEIDDLLF